MFRPSPPKISRRHPPSPLAPPLGRPPPSWISIQSPNPLPSLSPRTPPSPSPSRKNIVSAILGPEMAAPILWTPGISAFFLQENLHVHRFLVLGGEGVFWFWGGGGSADFMFMGAGIFLFLGLSHNYRLIWRNMRYRTGAPV